MDKGKYNDKDIDELLKIMNESRKEMAASRAEKPKKEERPMADHNGNIFSEDEIDSSVMIDDARKLKAALEVANSYPMPRTKLEREQEKRQLQKQKEQLIKKKREEKKKTFKKIIIAILTGSVITATAYAVSEAVPKFKDNAKISDTKDKLKDLGEDNLIMYGLGTKEDGKFRIGNNSVSDYSALEADTALEVYIYKLAIDDSEEFNKFIRSVTYDDGTYCYESYEQFLRINGFYDLTTNKISNEVFTNIMDGTLLSAYNNGTLSSYEEEFYTSDLDSSPKTR